MKGPVGVYVFFVAAFFLQKTYSAAPPFQNFWSSVFTTLVAAGEVPAETNYLPVEEYNNVWGTGLCSEKCLCGVSNQEARIVGGKLAGVNEYPWTVALVRNSKVFCGGTLITDLHVLTAAHCLQGNILMLRMQTTILIAEHDLSETTESPTVFRRIASVVRHHKFKPRFGNFEGDVAIIRMWHPVRFNKYISPVCLPPPDLNFAGAKGVVAGWGRTSEKGKPSMKLRKAVVPILSQEYCLSHSKYTTNTLTEHMMCAGKMEGGIDSCQGDSGGALLTVDTFQRLVVAGIVSWGEGCARPFRPGVYTRVNHFLSWIQENTKDGCFCA